jgi:hypothetical protein
VFAHRRTVRAAAGKRNLPGFRKQAAVLPAKAFHHGLGQASLQKLDQRRDRSAAVGAQRFPLRLGHGRHADPHRVHRRAADERPDLAGPDLQIHDGALPHVAAPALQTVREVVVAFQILAPRLAPERLGDRAPGNDDRC